MTSAALPLSAPTRRQVRYVLVAAAILGAVIGIDTLRVHLQLDPLADVHAYYDAGARLNAGLPLYEQPATTDDAAFYRYPPLLAILFRPLATLPFEQAALIWEGLVILAFVATLVRLGISRGRTWLLVGWLAAPIAWSIAIGQAHIPMTLLMAIGSPWAIAMAANLKVFPALLAVWWIGRREWRPLGVFLGWMAALLVLQLVLEPEATVAFLTFADLAQVGGVENRSLYGVSPALWIASVLALLLVALRLAPTRWGWLAAVALSVFATPRLLMYQLSALLAAGIPTSASSESRR